MNKIKNKLHLNSRSLVLLVLTAVVLAVTIGTTFAVYSYFASPKENFFRPAEPNDTISEEFPDEEKKTKVVVKNNGEYEEFIRVAIVMNWKDAEGNVLAAAVDKTHVVASFNTTDWVYNEKDGYYYHLSSVMPGKSTANLVGSDGITMDQDGINAGPENGIFSVEIISQNIQAHPDDAVLEAWGLTVKDGKLVVNED